eukprot:3663941-Rhodomonas_salina.1
MLLVLVVASLTGSGKLESENSTCSSTGKQRPVTVTLSESKSEPESESLLSSTSSTVPSYAFLVINHDLLAGPRGVSVSETVG